MSLTVLFIVKKQNLITYINLIYFGGLKAKKNKKKVLGVYVPKPQATEVLEHSLEYAARRPTAHP